MPFYDFKCDQCGHEEEKLVRSKDTKVKCPKCDTLMKRLISKAFAQTASRRIR